MNAWTIIFLLPAIAIFLACSKKEERTFPANFEVNNSLQTSTEHLLGLIDRRPENINNYLRLAELYYQSDNLDDAVEIVKAGLEEVPGNQEAQLLLAKYYLERGNIEQAEENLLKLDDENETVEYNRVQAELLINKGFFDKALQIINTSIVKDEGNAELHYLKGIIQLRTSDTLSALNSFNRAIRSENVKFMMVKDHLDLLVDLERYDAFYGSYNSLPASLRGRAELKLILAELLVVQGNPDSASVILHEIEEKEFLGLKFYRLAEIFYNSQKYDSSRYYGELSFNYTKDLSSKVLVARSFDRAYNYSAAENIYLEILAMDSANAIASEELEKLQRKIRYLREIKRKEEQRKMEIAPLRPITPEN